MQGPTINVLISTVSPEQYRMEGLVPESNLHDMPAWCMALKLSCLSKFKRLVLFEDFSEFNDGQLQWRRGHTDAGHDFGADPIFGREIGEGSLNLEHFSMAFLSDAQLFFQTREPTWVWHNLETLALTSHLLQPDEDHAKINAMLKEAAAAAMKMPQLRTMEIWNGREGLAGVFRYQTFKSRPEARITWRATWNLPLDPDMVTMWEVVAQENAGAELTIVQGPLGRHLEIESLDHAISKLCLVNEVVRPVSLWQMYQERQPHFSAE